MKPYKDTGNGIRVFEETVDPTDMLWHRDQEDRIVEPVEETDWKVQLDGKLPIQIKQAIFIQKGVWHRAIKGTGPLKIKITKL